MNNIINNITNKIKDQKVIIACSTGVDSCVLLDLCMKAIPNEQIIVAHVNHGVREESKEEESYIKSFCDSHNLILEVDHLTFTTDVNFESNARAYRYNFFTATAEKYQAQYILLAHHANDNLETMLMRFMKKSSLKGYAGIEEETKYQNLILYRPLLKVSRLEIEQYANNNNIKFYNDHTNDELDHLRNRIRLEIVPLLLAENPNLIDAVNYYNESILGAANLLEEKVSEFVNEYVTKKEDSISFKVNDLLKYNDYLMKEILFSLLKPYELSISLINEIIKTIKSKKEKTVTQIKENLNLIKEYGNCIFTNKQLKTTNFSLKITEYGTYQLPNNTSFTVDKNNCYYTAGNKVVCYNIKSMPLLIRPREDGDRIRRKRVNKVTKEVHYYTQKVSDVLTNKKISYLDRLNTLVVTNEQNEVIIIVGLTIS